MLEGLVEWESTAGGHSFNITCFLCACVGGHSHLCECTRRSWRTERGSTSLFKDALWTQCLSKKMMSTKMLSENT